MTVSGINDDSVNASLYQCLHALESVSGNAYTGSHTQTTLSILTCHRFVLCLCYILICNKTHKVVVLIHYRQFLNLVLQ